MTRPSALMANGRGTLQGFLGRRLVLIPIAMFVGLVSSFLLYVTLVRDYFDYWVLPRIKDAYIYPQLRYTLFDIVLILLCVDGLAACVTCIQSAATNRGISGWPRRTLLTFVVLLVVLIVIGSAMLIARRNGY